MSNNNPILKIGQEVLFVIGLYQKEEKLHKKKTPHAERHINDLGVHIILASKCIASTFLFILYIICASLFTI